MTGMSSTGLVRWVCGACALVMAVMLLEACRHEPVMGPIVADTSGGNGGVDQVGGDGGQAHPGAPAFGKDLGQERAVTVIKIGSLEQAR